MRCESVRQHRDCLANGNLGLAVARGRELAERTQRLFGTNDVYKIATRTGTRLQFARWACVTIGEYCSRTRTVSVNLAAIEQAQQIAARDSDFINLDTSEAMLRRIIIAHELGHLCDEIFNAESPDESESVMFREEVSHGFAASLLGSSIDEYEKLWRLC